MSSGGWAYADSSDNTDLNNVVFFTLIGINTICYLSYAVVILISTISQSEKFGFGLFAWFSFLGVVGRMFELFDQVRDPDDADTVSFKIGSAFVYFFINFALISFVFPIIQSDKTIPTYQRNRRARKAFTIIIPTTVLSLLVQLLLATSSGYHAATTFGNGFILSVYIVFCVMAFKRHSIFKRTLFMFVLILLKTGTMFLYTDHKLEKYFKQNYMLSTFLVFSYLLFELFPLVVILLYYRTRLKDVKDTTIFISESSTTQSI